MALTFMLCGISSSGIQVVLVSFKPQVKFQEKVMKWLRSPFMNIVHVIFQGKYFI